MRTDTGAGNRNKRPCPVKKMENRPETVYNVSDRFHFLFFSGRTAGFHPKGEPDMKKRTLCIVLCMRRR